MSLTNAPTLPDDLPESVVDTAEHHRRWLRRACWIGGLVTITALFVVICQPSWVRWRFQRHGWNVGERYSGYSIWENWQREMASRWIAPVEKLELVARPVLPGDVELLRHFPILKSISLEGTAVQEATAIAFARCPRLESVSLSRVTLDDNCFPHLADCKALRFLTITSTAVADESLSHLQRLDQLIYLRLPQTGSVGLKHITNCLNLHSLEINDALFTDVDINFLSRFAKLNSLSFDNCPLTDEGAKTLTISCPGLTHLTLNGNRLTDAALTYLADLPELWGLSLVGQPITDEGLRELRKCAKLRSLDIRDSKVTSDGISNLKRTKSDLIVHY